MFIRSVFILLCILITTLVKAQKRECNADRLNIDPPKIDGIFDDSVWSSGEWCGDFVQLKPYENRKPSQQTQFKIVYDDNSLYIAIRCFDSSPDSIESRMSRRDEEEGDIAGIGFDSYHDQRTAFVFGVTAAGVKFDATVTENGDNWDYSWDPIWYVETKIDQSGWYAEMKIPLSQLRFGKQESYIWGLQVARNIFRNGEETGWQFISPNAAGWVSYFGELHGINKIIPQKQADIVPYTVGKYDKYKKDKENPFADGNDYSGTIGLDGKIGITNDLTLDFTINPDFGQVEADPSEVNLSTYETYLQEKRPFFIEGKSILNFRITDGGGNLSSDNIFYSRRIGKNPGRSLDIADNEYAKIPDKTTILGAAKITGKTRKGLSVGILECLTQKETAEIDLKGKRRIEEVEPFTSYFVGRIQKDMNNSNTRVGAIFTSANRDLSNPVMADIMINSAYTGGIDFNHQWKDKTYYIKFNAAFSQIRGSEEAIYEKQTSSPHYFQRPDAGNFHVDSARNYLNGFSGNVQIGKAGNGKWMFLNWVTLRSPGANFNDIGYLRSNDEIQQVFWVGFNQQEPFSVFRSFHLNINEWYGVSFLPETRYYGGNFSASCDFKNYWEMGVGISRDAKTLSTEALRGGPALLYDGSTFLWFFMETDYRKKIQFYFQYTAAFRDFNTAKETIYLSGMNFQISNAFKASLSATYKKSVDQIAYVNNIDSLNYKRYIRGKIIQEEVSLTLRLNYYLTPDFSVQFYGMPFISAGKYSEFKFINDSRASEFTKRYTQLIPGEQINYNYSTEYYDVDENGNGTDYSFEKPDFNKLDFNSNLVIRWEYRPGSTLFLVWSQNRYNKLTQGNFSVLNDTKELFSIFPRNVLLIKLSYRFGL